MPSSSSCPRPHSCSPLGLVELLDWTSAALDRVDRAAFFDRFDAGEAGPYFYEPFLEAFDPDLRKRLGVWYTPAEVVRYMLARVDMALKEDLVTDHPMIPREHLALWLGVSEGRVSQMMHSLVDTCGLVERRGKRGDVRYTLSAEGIRYITHRDRAQLPTTRGIWSTALTTDRQGRRRHVGHRIETWARQTKHADGITLVPLGA